MTWKTAYVSFDGSHEVMSHHSDELVESDRRVPQEGGYEFLWRILVDTPRFVALEWVHPNHDTDDIRYVIHVQVDS